MILQTFQTSNNREGSGKYKPLARKVKKQSKEKMAEFAYLNRIDSRMRFNNSKDPIYFAFEYLEKRSVVKLAQDFVEESFLEIVNFVSKVVK